MARMTALPSGREIPAWLARIHDRMVSEGLQGTTLI